MLPLPVARQAGSVGLRKGQRPRSGLTAIFPSSPESLAAMYRLAYNPTHPKRGYGEASDLRVV